MFLGIFHVFDSNIRCERYLYLCCYIVKKLIKRKQNVFNLVAYIFKYNIRINILTKKNNK